jgi:hypothetical protein
MAIDQEYITNFYEKPGDGERVDQWGFLVLNAKVLDYIGGDATSWKTNHLNTWPENGQMIGLKHRGGRALWKIWDKVDTRLPTAGYPSPRLVVPSYLGIFFCNCPGEVS